MANSITAWALLMAAIWPSKLAVASFWSVMSTAYFTTLNGAPRASRIGL